jgi:predicted dehydrogenase
MKYVQFRKFYSFVRLYGLGRTFSKVIGRTRLPITLVRQPKGNPDIAMIGCGQFGFSTVGYFVNRRFGARFRWCYDPDAINRKTFARHYRVLNAPEEPEGWNEDPAIQTVYIASNHSSHAEYAIESLSAGKIVYIEKPIAVSLSQLKRLENARKANNGRVYVGYNRPFSPAVQQLRKALGSAPTGGITLSCFVGGHVIPPDHWYRNPKEGTRICGNAGHWIDLFVHMLSWRNEWPQLLRLSLIPASISDPDDNFVVTVATDKDDIFSLTLTSRSEPFEGINETINFQQDNVIATINDFRSMTLWTNSRFSRNRYRPKNVGHEAAILQPYADCDYRDWEEILRSTLLTLEISEMVRLGETTRELNLSGLLTSIRSSVSEAAK